MQRLTSVNQQTLWCWWSYPNWTQISSRHSGLCCSVRVSGLLCWMVAWHSQTGYLLCLLVGPGLRGDMTAQENMDISSIISPCYTDLAFKIVSLQARWLSERFLETVKKLSTAVLYKTEAQRLMLFSESSRSAPDRLTRLTLSYLKTGISVHISSGIIAEGRDSQI